MRCWEDPDNHASGAVQARGFLTCSWERAKLIFMRACAQDPFRRLLALLMSVWAWLQRQVSRLTNHSSSGSGAPSSA